jgi:hemerythrin
MLQWKSSYSVNIRKIDLQHRKVLGIINRLYSMQSNEVSRSEMDSLFRELRDFIQTHFRDEEELMLRYNYPGYVEQKQEHDAFVDMVCEHQKNFLKDRPTTAINLFNSLWDWFARHIVQLDKKYVPYLQSKGVA